jgi:hypothetical protein
VRGFEGAIALLSAELHHCTRGRFPPLERAQCHDVQRSEEPWPSSSCTRDYFSDIVAVWMLRFVLLLQMSVNCPEDPVTVLALRTPVVTFLSYICRSVLQGEMRHLHALMPALGACHAIDGSLLPATGVLVAHGERKRGNGEQLCPREAR